MILIPIKVVGDELAFSIALADPEVIEFFESKRDLPQATSVISNLNVTLAR